MPSPISTSDIPVPNFVWEKAETAEMAEIITLYCKTFHLWQVDRGDQLPLGSPKFMGSFTEQESFPGFDDVLAERDKRYGTDQRKKMELRKNTKEPELHPDVDVVNMNSARPKMLH